MSRVAGQSREQASPELNRTVRRYRSRIDRRNMRAGLRVHGIEELDDLHDHLPPANGTPLKTNSPSSSSPSSFPYRVDTIALMPCGRSSARGPFPGWTFPGSTPTARATIPGYDVTK